jgi:hypothetical protein
MLTKDKNKIRVRANILHNLRVGKTKNKIKDWNNTAKNMLTKDKIKLNEKVI